MLCGLRFAYSPYGLSSFLTKLTAKFSSYIFVKYLETNIYDNCWNNDYERNELYVVVMRDKDKIFQCIETKFVKQKSETDGPVDFVKGI